MPETRIHPPAAPERPYWRGVSDLYGPIGDALYGYYDRSDNIMVRDMGSVEKRRGAERAFDELFHNAVGVAVGRDESALVFLAVDSEGFKVLSALPQSEFVGFTLDHPGFMYDDFTRGDNTDIQTGTTLPWIEGKTSEENTAHTAGALLRIASNQLRKNDADAASHADWNHEAPTLYHTLRVEMDMSAVGLDTGQDARIYIYMGLPDFYTAADGSIVKNRIWSVDAKYTIDAGTTGTDHAWAGIAGMFRLNAASNTTQFAEMSLWEFASSQPQESLADRVGKIGATETKTSASALSDASTEVTWVMEIGRKQGIGGGWVTRMDIYQNTTITTLEAGDVSTLWKSIEFPERIINESVSGGFYWNIPISGKGGYAGLRMQGAGAPAGGSNRIERIKPALKFLQDQFPE